ncbi:MAG TPA: Ig-like domain-containing protein, partial [Actinomycetota bacterium]|nr:Ig-like domain-containing protein [Actinomycetota bacterium]
QNNQVGNQGRLAGAQVTFTIQGPGRIYAPNANGGCNTNAQPAAGTTVTVTADNNGIAFACLYSQQVGRTTVTATSGTPAQSATGTKDWVVNPNAARFIQLCHSDVAGTVCETGVQLNEAGDEHQMTARVTDAQGNPVPDVPVQFRETGPGIFTPQRGSSATVNTDANGLAAVLLTSDVEGTSTIVAEIMAGSGLNGARGGGAADDECEAPAGTNNQPAAGNCISQSLTKIWEEEPVNGIECDDGIDNDGDDLIDYPDDPGCLDDADGSELPVNETTEHVRTISMRFDDPEGGGGKRLVVFGRLRARGFSDCRKQMPVNVQRRVNGRWITKKTTTTNGKGRYAVEIFDLASRYRAVAPRTEVVDEDLSHIDICRRAVKAKRHRHRR